MTVQDHLRILRERWLSVLVCLLLGLGAAATFFAVQPSRYTAGSQLYVSTPIAANSDVFLSATQLAQERVKSYTALLTSPAVLSRTIRDLNLSTTPDALRNQIEATAVDEAVVINLTVTDRSAARSAQIADSIGESLRLTVEEIERPRGPAAIAPVAVRSIQPAIVPTEPSSYGLGRIAAIGLLLGLAAGVAAAFAKHGTDSSVKSPDQLTELVEAPSLGEITHDARIAKQPLLVLEDLQGRLAEDIRRLRTNLQFVDAGNAHKVLTLTSALPSEGKTTVSINLAAALGAAGMRVLLIDADLRRPRAADLLGVERAVGLTSVLARRVNVDDVLYHHQRGRFDVLPSGPLPPNPSELLASGSMRDLLGSLRERYDVVLIDTSPLLPVTDAAALAPSTDGVLLVCRYKRTTRAQVRSAAAAVRRVDVAVRGAILTAVDGSTVRLPSYAATYRTDPVSEVMAPTDRDFHESSEQTTSSIALRGGAGRGQHRSPDGWPAPTNGRQGASRVGLSARDTHR